jgi:hypothetical protein
MRIKGKKSRKTNGARERPLIEQTGALGVVAAAACAEGQCKGKNVVQSWDVCVECGVNATRAGREEQEAVAPGPQSSRSPGARLRLQAAR